MKAKIRIIIIGMVMLCLAGVYAVIDKNRSIYDTDCDASLFQGIFLEEKKEVVQRFVCEEDELDAIAFKIAADDQIDRKKIRLSYQLTEKASGKQAAKGETDLSRLKVGKFFSVRFPKVTGCQGKEYEFSVSLEERGGDGNVRLFYTPGRSEAAELFYEGDEIDGIGLFRTVTHRFDLETFVVTASFLIYIAVFMRWLYKLFK